MFALEIVMQNIDPEYDVIVPLICACRRFAEVADNLPWETKGEPMYGCKKLRGDIIHGLRVWRNTDQCGDLLNCTYVVYGQSFRGFNWIHIGCGGPMSIELRYRDRGVYIDHLSAGIYVYDGSRSYYSGRITAAQRHPDVFVKEADKITRAVLGMTPADLLRLL